MHYILFSKYVHIHFLMHQSPLNSDSAPGSLLILQNHLILVKCFCNFFLHRLQQKEFNRIIAITPLEFIRQRIYYS